MLKRRKKLISKLVMLTICISLAATTTVLPGITNVVCASAATATSESSFVFDTSTGTITKYTGTDTIVVIPSTIGGVSVKSIGKNAFYSSYLTSITIPNSVTSIGVQAFAFCYDLTSATIPNSVTSIGNSAFYSCSNLTSITLSNKIKSIETCTFFNCHKLTKVIIPNSVTSIGNQAFGNCEGLTSITIPNSVTSIGEYAIKCSKLTSITIPDSVTSMGNSAFYDYGQSTFYVNSETTKQLLINLGVSESKIILKS